MRILSDVLDEYIGRLARVHIQFPEKEAKAILSYVLGIESEKLYSFLHSEVDAVFLEKAEQIVSRREKREPLVRILGQVNFLGVTIHVANDVFRPCPEAGDVVEHALAALGERQDQEIRILDLGTGTGCLLLALLHALPKATGIGVDIDQKALAAAQINAEANQLSARSQFLRGDWAKGLDEKFDLVISNPPAALTKKISLLSPEMRNYDPLIALDGGKDGLSFFKAIVHDFERVTKPSGLGVFRVYFTNREASVFRKAGFPAEIKTNYCGEPCCMIVKNKKHKISFLQRVCNKF